MASFLGQKEVEQCAVAAVHAAMLFLFGTDSIVWHVSTSRSKIKMLLAGHTYQGEERQRSSAAQHPQQAPNRKSRPSLKRQPVYRSAAAASGRVTTHT